MKAYIAQTDRGVEPFGDHPRDLLIVNRPLAAWQDEALRALALEPTHLPPGAQVDDPDEYVVVEDRLFFTPELLDAFIARSRALGSSTRCALKRGVTTFRSILSTQGVTPATEHVEYDLRYEPRHGARGQAQLLVIDPDFITWPIKVMPQLLSGEEKGLISITDTLLMRIDHWTNLWCANLFGLVFEPARLARAARQGASLDRRLRLARKVLPAMLRARSFSPWTAIRRLSTIGRGCQIHPSATVESSILGDKVTIGPGARVVGSVLGSGSSVGANTSLTFSVVGERTQLVVGPMMGCVFYPDSFNAGWVMASIFGRNTFVAGGVCALDFRVDGKAVEVEKDGALVDSQQLWLGSAFGHDAALGALCVVPPGRAVPNGWRIALEPNRFLRKFPPEGDIPGYQVVRPTHPR